MIPSEMSLQLRLEMLLLTDGKFKDWSIRVAKNALLVSASDHTGEMGVIVYHHPFLWPEGPDKVKCCHPVSTDWMYGGGQSY